MNRKTRRIAPTVEAPRPPPPRRRAATIPPPRPVRHVRTLWWWLAALVAAVAVHQVQDSRADRVEPAAALAPGTERTAFIAFSLARVGDGTPDAVAPTALRAQLAHLKESGAHFIGLEQVAAFYRDGTALPPQPVLLVLDEARRETVDAVDPILAELRLRAVALVSTDAVEQANIHLVSRRQLGQMAASGRWQMGVNACPAETGVTPDAIAADYRRRVSILETWSAQPVLAASCLRRWTATPAVEDAWARALRAVPLPLAFVGRSPAVNRADDPAHALRLIPVSGDDREPDALARLQAAYTPRNKGVIEDFSGGRLASAWVTSRDRARVRDGSLQLTAPAGDSGGTLTLGGTERWTDARITVRLDGPPTGQFWIYARRSSPGSFVRLGIVDGTVVLQNTDAEGQTRQVAAAPAPSGKHDLTLHVIGARAIALLDGQPLLDRPAELPASLDRGEVALVVWNPDSNAAATLRKVEVEPLLRRVALLNAAPADAEFDRLRREGDGFWAVSPRLYRWSGGRGYASDEVAVTLSIFAGHQRLAMLPAVTVDRLPGGKDWDRFGEKLAEWAAQPSYAGLNLVLGQLRPQDVGRLEKLRESLLENDRELTVTLSAGTGHPDPLPAFVLFDQSPAGTPALSVAGLRAVPG